MSIGREWGKGLWGGIPAGGILGMAGSGFVNSTVIKCKLLRELFT